MQCSELGAARPFCICGWYCDSMNICLCSMIGFDSLPLWYYLKYIWNKYKYQNNIRILIYKTIYNPISTTYFATLVEQSLWTSTSKMTINSELFQYISSLLIQTHETLHKTKSSHEFNRLNLKPSSNYSWWFQYLYITWNPLIIKI